MLLKLYEKNNNPADLQQVIDILNDGGIIIYPTDTMYAIGCHGLKERAIERTATQKHRPQEEQPFHHLLRPEQYQRICQVRQQHV
ncbi:MAG: L-threonylcarbamoyladenylate synthase [Bacteroides stercoris]